MKNCKIKNYSVKGSKYQVALGNGCLFVFKSIKHKDKFLTVTSKFLTECLIKINRVYIQTFSKYREAWFYFYDEKKPNPYLHTRTEIECKADLIAVQDILDRLVLLCKGVNGNHWTFSMLDKSCSILITTLSGLKTLHASRSNTFELYECNALINDLVIIKSSLKNYGLAEAVEVRIQSVSQSFQLPLNFKNYAIGILQEA